MLGRLGALLVREHYDFDPKRFIPATSRTAQGYGSFLDPYHVEVVMGDGQALFTRLEALRKVTAKDIQRVAKQYFDARRRTRISVIPERTRSGNHSGSSAEVSA